MFSSRVGGPAGRSRVRTATVAVLALVVTAFAVTAATAAGDEGTPLSSTQQKLMVSPLASGEVRLNVAAMCVTPTVFGTFHFYLKTPGTNAKGMFDSNFFIGGYAIHGYPEVPTYAASHGCIRVSNADAPAIFAWVSLGDPIYVYR